MGDKRLICDKCPFSTAHEKALRGHQVTSHKIGDAKFKCELCPYKSNYKTVFMRHIEGVHAKIKDNVCEECGYATMSKQNLKTHKESVHKMGDKKLE